MSTLATVAAVYTGGALLTTLMFLRAAREQPAEWAVRAFVLVVVVVCWPISLVFWIALKLTQTKEDA